MATTADAAELSAAGSKRSADSAADGRRSRKGKKGRRNGNGSSVSGGPQSEPQAQELVAVSPLAPSSEILQDGRRTVWLSKVDKAPQMSFCEDRLTITSQKGYRMVRATHGVHEGTWYFEVNVRHLGSTGHARVGWATRSAELQAPVGYDQHGYGYRDLEGSKVHKGLREEYGEPYREGDVIGCLLHLPPGGRPFLPTRNDVGSSKGNLYLREQPADVAPPQPLSGAAVAFSRNGASQGIAYRNMVEGTYFPAVSMYTLPEQTEGATLSVNFGPEFAHARPEIEGIPAARPVSDLPAVEEELAAAAAEAAMAAEAAPEGPNNPAQQQQQQEQNGVASRPAQRPPGPVEGQAATGASAAPQDAARIADQGLSSMQADGNGR